MGPRAKMGMWEMMDSSASRPRTIKVSFALALLAIVAGAAGYSLSHDRADAQSNQPAAATAAWSMQSDCVGCHKTEAASRLDGIHLASKHRGFECTVCHRNEATLRVAHRDLSKNPNPPGLRTPVDNSVCFGCHVSWDSLSNLTVSSRVLTDKKGRVVNPHAIPKTAAHRENPYCFTCHDMHKGVKKVGGYCVGCHHKEVYECNTCHKVGE